jgi:hypothetical protein
MNRPQVMCPGNFIRPARSKYTPPTGQTTGLATMRPAPWGRDVCTQRRRAPRPVGARCFSLANPAATPRRIED